MSIGKSKKDPQVIAEAVFGSYEEVLVGKISDYSILNELPYSCFRPESLIETCRKNEVGRTYFLGPTYRLEEDDCKFADGFSCDTSVYALVKVESFTGLSTVSVNNVDDGPTKVWNSITVKYLCVCGVADKVVVTFVKLHAKVVNEDLISWHIEQYVPERAEYYRNAGRPEVWSDLKSCITELFEGWRKRLSEDQDLREKFKDRFNCEVGRMDSVLSVPRDS